MPKPERKWRPLVVVDRGVQLAERVREIAKDRGTPAEVQTYGSVLEVLGEQGPQAPAGLVCTVTSTGPFLQDLLRWTDRDTDSRIPTAVVGGGEGDSEAVDAVLGRNHVRWIEESELEEGLVAWLRIALEVEDLRAFRTQHDAHAQQLRDARTRLFSGEISTFGPGEGPPCGPPLPTSIEEIQPLRDARAQFERGLIRAAVRETGSLKDASAALGISYTSLWRRMR